MAERFRREIFNESASPGGMRGQGTMTVKNYVSAFVIGAVISSFTASATSAAPAEISSGSTKVADAVQTQSVAAVEEEDAGVCSRSRKRLWVEGEGWIVRRVTICR